MNNCKQSIKTKSKTKTFKALLYAILVLIITIFTYVASLVPYNIEGYFGFSSLRVTINQISFYLFAFLASCRLFYIEKGRTYRFIYLIPIVVLGYNLLINIFDARQTYFNEFTPKIGLTFLVLLLITLYYFYKKAK